MNYGMRHTLNMTLIAILGLNSGTHVLANGFVKSSNQFYTKLSVDQTQRKSSEKFAINQTETASRVYAEYGLGLPWQSQAVVKLAHLSIATESEDLKDKFTSAAPADSDFELKSAIGTTSLGPLELRLAQTLGLNLATTSKKFRHTNIDDRRDDAPATRRHLIASIDNGSNALILGFGASLSYSAVWINIEQRVENDLVGKWHNLQSSAALGVGLPANSWLQVGVSQFRSYGSATSALTDATSSTTVSTSASLGYTFYQGFAAEFGYTRNIDDQHVWSKQIQYQLGISLRSI